MYERHNVPWFILQDNYIDSLATASDALANVQSVSQLDKQKQTGPPSDLINPDNPPYCPRHRKTISSCILRPCGHLACQLCLGKALLGGSKCTECNVTIAKFVGMKRPIPVVAKASDEDSDEEWNVQEMEDLAAAAADTNRVSIIYFAGDRVPPLHPGPQNYADDPRGEQVPSSPYMTYFSYLK